MTSKTSAFKIYGDRLIAARGSRTRAEIERLSGVPATNIKRAEDGENQPPISLLLFYASEGVTPDLILLGEKPDLQINKSTLRLAIASLTPSERLEIVAEIAAVAPFDTHP